MGLDLDGGSLLSQELLSPDVHAELGLDLQGSCVVPCPLFLNFVGPKVVELLR